MSIITVLGLDVRNMGSFHCSAIRLIWLSKARLCLPEMVVMKIKQDGPLFAAKVLKGVILLRQIWHGRSVCISMLPVGFSIFTC